MINLGTYREVGDGMELKWEFHLNHPIAKVWKAISDPNEIKKWFCTGEFENRVGGKVDLEFNHPQDESGKKNKIEGQVTIFDPTSTLEYTWELFTPPSTVRYDLKEANGGTDVVFTSMQYEAGFLDKVMPGWHSWIERIGQSIEKGDLGLLGFERWDELYVQYWGRTYEEAQEAKKVEA